MRKLHPRGTWQGPRNPTRQDARCPPPPPVLREGQAHPTPGPVSPQPAQLFRGDTSTESPLPPAIIRGVSAPPRCRGQLSTPLYIILLYSRAVLSSYGSRKHGQDTIRGGPCLPPVPTPLSPSFWALDPHSGGHSRAGSYKSVALPHDMRCPPGSQGPASLWSP